MRPGPAEPAPPGGPSSSTTTDAPRSRAASAAAMPTTPAPTTTRSGDPVTGRSARPRRRSPAAGPRARARRPGRAARPRRGSPGAPGRSRRGSPAGASARRGQMPPITEPVRRSASARSAIAARFAPAARASAFRSSRAATGTTASTWPSPADATSVLNTRAGSASSARAASSPCSELGARSRVVVVGARGVGDARGRQRVQRRRTALLPASPGHPSRLRTGRRGGPPLQAAGEAAEVVAELGRLVDLHPPSSIIARRSAATRGRHRRCGTRRVASSIASDGAPPRAEQAAQVVGRQCARVTTAVVASRGLPPPRGDVGGGVAVAGSSRCRNRAPAGGRRHPVDAEAAPVVPGRGPSRRGTSGAPGRPGVRLDGAPASPRRRGCGSRTARARRRGRPRRAWPARRVDRRAARPGGSGTVYGAERVDPPPQPAAASPARPCQRPHRRLLDPGHRRRRPPPAGRPRSRPPPRRRAAAAASRRRPEPVAAGEAAHACTG